jgi:hypothetical protein
MLPKILAGHIINNIVSMYLTKRSYLVRGRVSFHVTARSTGMDVIEDVLAVIKEMMLPELDRIREENKKIKALWL